MANLKNTEKDLMDKTVSRTEIKIHLTNKNWCLRPFVPLHFQFSGSSFPWKYTQVISMWNNEEPDQTKTIRKRKTTSNNKQNQHKMPSFDYMSSGSHCLLFAVTPTFPAQSSFLNEYFTLGLPLITQQLILFLSYTNDQLIKIQCHYCC